MTACKPPASCKRPSVPALTTLCSKLRCCGTRLPCRCHLFNLLRFPICSCRRIRQSSVELLGDLLFKVSWPCVLHIHSATHTLALQC